MIRGRFQSISRRARPRATNIALGNKASIVFSKARVKSKLSRHPRTDGPKVSSLAQSATLIALSIVHALQSDEVERFENGIESESQVNGGLQLLNPMQKPLCVTRVFHVRWSLAVKSSQGLIPEKMGSITPRIIKPGLGHMNTTIRVQSLPTANQYARWLHCTIYIPNYKAAGIPALPTSDSCIPTSFHADLSHSIHVPIVGT